MAEVYPGPAGLDCSGREPGIPGIVLDPTTYRFELPFVEDLGEDDATQRHRHDEDEGEGQGGHGGLNDPQGHDARQLHHGEHVHTPCLHLKPHKKMWIFIKDGQ